MTEWWHKQGQPSGPKCLYSWRSNQASAILRNSDQEKRRLPRLWETKDLLGTELRVMFSAVPGYITAVLTWLSARSLWDHFDQDVMSSFLFFKLTLIQQLNISSGSCRRWSRQLQTWIAWTQMLQNSVASTSRVFFLFFTFIAFFYLLFCAMLSTFCEPCM